MADLEVRTATLHDVEDVHRLEVLAFPAPWRREFFQSELDSSGRFNLVVRHDGLLAGYLFAMWFFDEMHVNKIAVAQAQRRQGVATELMNRCLAFARANQIASISLEVRKSNHGAQKFYRSLDFLPSYERKRYYPDGEAAVVMTRTLERGNGV